MLRIIRFVGLSIKWLCTFVGVLVLSAIIGGMILVGHYGFQQDVMFPQQAWLSADIRSGINEDAKSKYLSYFLPDAPNLEDFVFGLEEAADDHRVKGLYVQLGMAPIGFATAQEIRDAVIAFRRSGKPAYAFAESFSADQTGTINYFLASGFDKVFLQPSGDLGYVGFGIEQPFVKGLLDKLGITPQMDGRKDFKGALYSITRDHMPDPVRNNLHALTDDWLDLANEAIATTRHITRDNITDILQRAPLSAYEAIDANLIDAALYHDQSLDRLLAATGLSIDDEVPLAHYQRNTDSRYRDESGPIVAIITVNGNIVSGDSDFANGVFGADSLARAIDAAVQDGAKAVILRVNSPGGSYLAADSMWHDVSRLEDQRVPVIISFGDIAASGGYFLAVPGQRIIANPASLVGSIGVFGGKIVFSSLWDKIGLSVEGVASGDRALMESPHRSYSAQEWATFQRSLDRIYADFTSKVAKGRKLPADRVEEMAQGQIYSGKRALELGLVDELGGLQAALLAAKQSAEIAADAKINLRFYPDEDERLKALLSNLFGNFDTKANLISVVEGLSDWRQHDLRFPLWLYP